MRDRERMWFNAISTLTCVVAGCPAAWTICNTSRTGSWPSEDGCVHVWGVNSVCWKCGCSTCRRTPFWPSWAGACGSRSLAVLPRTWLGRSFFGRCSTSWFLSTDDGTTRQSTVSDTALIPCTIAAAEYVY